MSSVSTKDQTSQVLDSIRRDFDPRQLTPKYHQIKCALETQIKRGALRPSDRLPAAQKLATTLGVTRVTIDRALNEMVSDRLIERVPGRGTFVRSATSNITVNDIAALIMPSHGDVWERLVRGIVSGLSQQQQYCMVHQFVLKKDQPADPEAVTKIERLVNHEPAHLVVRGVSRFPYQTLSGYEGQLIFAESFESDEQFDACHVLADYREGGRVIGEHLARLGRTDLIYFVGGTIRPQNRLKRAVLDGVTEVFEQLERNATVRVVEQADSDAGQARLRELVAQGTDKLAVLCLGDYFARSVYQVASSLGRRIPDDLAVMGYYDTPWCYRLNPALTSVSIGEDRIAAAIIDTIIDRRRSGTQWIKPTLVTRQSCGSSPTEASAPAISQSAKGQDT